MNLVEIVRPTGADQIQRLYAAHGANCVGLSCGKPETFLDFAELMGPGVSHAILKKAFGRGGISTCVLACRGQARWIGLDAPYVRANWVPGRPGIDEESWYRSQGAWVDARTCDPSQRPGIGHEVYIGRGTVGEQYGGIQHAFRVIRWIDDDTLESADGGCSDGTGLQCVGSWDAKTGVYSPSKKQWVERGGKSWLVNPRTGLGRMVYGWALPELCLHDGVCLAPDGWETFV